MLISTKIVVNITIIFRNLIFVCITIKDKLIKHLYNSHLRKLPIAHGEDSVMYDKFLSYPTQYWSLKVRCLIQIDAC